MHNAQSRSDIPSWDQLIRYKQPDFANLSVHSQSEEAISKRPKILIWMARQFIRAFMRDASYQKFLDFTWREVVELTFDQATRNREMLENGKELDNISEFARSRQSIARPHNQLPCTPNTSKRRVELAKEIVAQDAPIIVVGDDDLVGLELARQGFTNVTSIDICENVCNYLKDQSVKEGLKLRVLQHDLNNSPPPEFVDHYQLVFMDPIYSQFGLELFFNGASNFLKDGSKPHYFLSLHCLSLLKEGLTNLPQFFQDRNLQVLKFLDSFNAYRIPARLAFVIRVFNKRFLRSRYLGQSKNIWPFFLSDAILLKKV